MNTGPQTSSTPSKTLARPESSFQTRRDVRVFATNQQVACRQDPELFFEPRKRRRAINLCAQCPFRGRCGYNAVVTGATHGIWGGIMLPGHFPDALKPLYAALAEQFQQRRHIEVGDIPVAAPSPPGDNLADDAPTPRATSAAA